MTNEVIIITTRNGNKIPLAKIGLLKDNYWRSDLKNYPTDLLCEIRKSLAESVPRLAEKFNPATPTLPYFGYKVKISERGNYDPKRAYSEDRAYIYVRRDRLQIDLKIAPKFACEIRKAGFELKAKTNFQGKVGWLTGWHVPHSTEDLDSVVKWVVKALKGGGNAGK